MRTILIFLAFIFFVNPIHANDAKINPELQRGLDGRSAVDQVTDAELTRIATEAILLQEFGISPELIKTAKELALKEQDAAFDNSPAEMIKEVITVSTDPSAMAPTIYTTPGHATIVNVIDQTGEPWPLVLASSGNDTLFKTAPIENHKYKNVFRLQAQYRVGSSNLTLLLADKALSVTIKVISSKDRYHPQPILQITDNGPFAKPLRRISSNLPIKNDNLMKNLIFEIAPLDFTRVKTNSNEVVVWKSGERLFVKTKLIPTYPDGYSIYRGPNGYAAYEMPSLPVLIMSDSNGISHQISILGE